MIFIANNTREIEKNNVYLKKKISKISENLKINKIELATHQNSSYLKTRRIQLQKHFRQLEFM